MSEARASTRTPQEAARCEIRLKGHLDGRWVGWFDGLSLTLESDGITTIHGSVVDEAALYGVLQTVRDVGLPLVSLTYVGRDQPDVTTFPTREDLTKERKDTKSLSPPEPPQGTSPQRRLP